MAAYLREWLAGLSVHGLRHTHASHLLSLKVPIKVVSHRLGHARVTETMNTYAHLLPGMDQAAVEAFSADLYGDDDPDTHDDHGPTEDESGSGCSSMHAVPQVCGTFEDMAALEVLDELNRLLDVDGEGTVNTSMRLPTALRDAAALAVRHLGVADSTTSLTAAALRRALETAVMEAALEAHFEQHPHARPSIAEVARALAAQDGSPLADRPELIERAAAQVAARHPDADADDVLLWAEAQLAASA